MIENIEELQKKQREKINSYYEVFFSHMKVGVFLTDYKGNFIEVNKEFCDMVGYSEKELLSLNFKDITYEKDLQKSLIISNTALEKKQKSFTIKKRYLRKDDKIIWIEVLINHIKNRDDKYLHTIGFVVDITKIKKNQDIILEQTKTMQLYLDIVDVMIVAIDKNGDITLINRKASELLGYKEEEMIGRNWFNKFLEEEDREKFLNNYINIINKKIDLVNKVQYKVICRDRKKRVISWRRAYIYDDENNIIGVISSGEDITDVIKLEAKNKETEQVLLNQSKMASMGEMLRNVAHQWRQPLSTISTAASGIMIQKELGILRDDEFYNSMGAIVNTTKYLSHTIDDFQNFFKIDSSATTFSIKNLLENVENLVKTSYKINEIELQLEFSESISFKTYYNDLIQVIINLLNNAKDAFEESTFSNRVVFINTAIEDDNLVIIVKDNAGGIPESILDRVFEPYFTTKYQSLGTGIGLYMTKDIIENRLGGTIEVSNKKMIYKQVSRCGATFKLRVPSMDI